MSCFSGLILIFCVIIQITQLRSLSLENFLMTGPKAYLQFADSVAVGIQIGVTECQFQFRWDKWNCPHTAFPVYSGNEDKEVTRESSFARAISAGSVLHTVTWNCSTGGLKGCACDVSKNGQKGGPRWLWGGCSDNVAFGDQISRLFIDNLETGKDTKAAVNLHNNEAGRKAVKRTMRLLCKCHGVSGSCTTKTCWRQLSTFREAGSHLKRRYNRAVKVDFQNVILHDNKDRKRARFSRENRNNFRKTDLLFLDQSPDYCFHNGTHRTLGRECSRPVDRSRVSRTEKKSCKVLCASCGLGVSRKMVKVESTCYCKFYWCCSVKCKICREMKEIFTCTLI